MNQPKIDSKLKVVKGETVEQPSDLELAEKTIPSHGGSPTKKKPSDSQVLPLTASSPKKRKPSAKVAVVETIVV